MGEGETFLETMRYGATYEVTEASMNCSCTELYCRDSVALPSHQQESNKKKKKGNLTILPGHKIDRFLDVL